MKNPSTQSVARIKTALAAACLLPFARLLAEGLAGRLGPDPVAAITHGSGVWALRLLLLTLAFTPVRKLTGWHWLARLRRTVALYAFFYACLHFFAYLLFEQSFDWPAIARDIARRPYLAAGFASFALMAPLAATSTDAMMKRLGGRNWQRLHRLSYAIAAGAVLHYFWLVKRDTTLPALYALALAALLCARMYRRGRKPQTPAARPARPGQAAAERVGRRQTRALPACQWKRAGKPLA